jgi:hypothetical protein
MRNEIEIEMICIYTHPNAISKFPIDFVFFFLRCIEVYFPLPFALDIEKVGKDELFAVDFVCRYAFLLFQNIETVRVKNCRN